jgi:hypothetical protein
MEHVWSQAVAADGNPWQMARKEKRLKQAKTVATGCDQLPIGAHGTEGVGGSSPSEDLFKTVKSRDVTEPRSGDGATLLPSS